MAPEWVQQAGMLSAYNSGMPLQVDAVYENGVLRPLQRLDLREHEHVLVSVVKFAAPGRSNLAVEYIENVKRELAGVYKIAASFWASCSCGMPCRQSPV
jgi:predicted DNA-binding antitoxin AbrB/MazE fold protein